MEDWKQKVLLDEGGKTKPGGNKDYSSLLRPSGDAGQVQKSADSMLQSRLYLQVLSIQPS